MDNLTMQWGARPVLDRVSLTMQPGERLAVVGAIGGRQVNGAATVGWFAAAHKRAIALVW
jgi:ABC-type hemin transport system ATPase subunit